MRTTLLLTAALLVLAGCRPEPRAIRYGEDTCAHCRMTVSDARFGTELVTATGKVHAFDSIECMVAFVHDHPDVAAQAHSLWVTAFNTPGTLMPLDEAFLLHAETMASPMGGNLAAFGPSMTPEAAQNVFGGEVVTWDDLLERAADAGAPEAHRTAHGSH